MTILIASFLLISSYGLLLNTSFGVDGSLLKVGKDQNYSTIQSAINRASDGDTIEVHAGIYCENIVVNKTISLIGNGSAETLIIGDGTDDVIRIESDWVNISDLSATTNNIGFNAGIDIVSDSDNVRIENCNLSNNYYGVHAYGSYSTINDLVIMNTTANWTEYGFYLAYCDDALIHNNTASYNDDGGIYFYYCNSGKVQNNTCNYNRYGIGPYYSSYSLFLNNTVLGNTWGLYTHYSDYAELYNNTASYNIANGIYLSKSEYGKVQNNTCNYNRNVESAGIRTSYAGYSQFWNNTLIGNDNGFYFYASDYAELHNNTVKENIDWGIFAVNSDNNKVENNTIIDSGYPFSETGYSGLEVSSCTAILIKNNSFLGCGMYMDQGSSNWQLMVIEDNTVNLKDLTYYSGKSGLSVPSNTGQVILYDCQDIDMDGLDLSNASVGVQVFESLAIEISNCDLGYNIMGIEIDDSSSDLVYNNITSNYINNTMDHAISLYTSSGNATHNIIDGNHIENGAYGISMDVSDSNSCSGYYNKIRNNTIMDLYGYGIDIEYIGYSNISNNHLVNASDGIYFHGSSSKNHHCTIENNTIDGCGHDGSRGMRLNSNYYSTIKNNTISNTDQYCISFSYADYSDIGDNYVENSDLGGFYMGGTDNAFIHGNTIKNEMGSGIYISTGGANSYRYNDLINCGFNIGTTSTNYWSTTSIDTTNKVNGKSVVMIYNSNAPTIPPNAGQVLLHTTDNVDIDCLDIRNVSIGIMVYGSDDVTIENSHIENVSTGLDIDFCADIRILNNTIANATIYGLYHDDSDGAHIFNNTFKDCGYPYNLEGYYGAYLYYSQDLYLENNTFERCGVYLYGSSTASYLTTHTFSNNTVNGRELAYINGQSSKTLNGSYGQVLIINSDNITLMDQNLSMATFGIQSTMSSHINITNVSADWNYRGIYFDPNIVSNWNRFENLSCSYNKEEGLYFYSSSSNTADHIYIANSTFEWNGADGLDLYCINDYAWIKNNDINNNTEYGLRMWGQSSSSLKYANITGNIIEFNILAGAILRYTTYGVIENNQFNNNTNYGVTVHYGDYSVVKGNTANGNNFEGIYVYCSDGVDILNNHFEANKEHGIRIYEGLQSSFNGEIAWNNLSMNQECGIVLDSDYHDVNNNTFYMNIRSGLFVSGTYGDNNVIVQNYFIENNMGGIQALDNEANNKWDDGNHGNYWSDHQTPDSDRDGIVDTSYSLGGSSDSIDRYPLVIGNIEPLITTADDTYTNPNNHYNIDYDATDANNDILTWHLSTNATFLSIVSNTGVLSGTPTLADKNRKFWVNVSVTDGNGGKDWTNFTLEVGAGNLPPSITTTDVTSINEDETYFVDYNAYDTDGDTLIWSIFTNASFLTIDTSTGQVSGTPSNDDVGTYWVNTTVDDGNGGTDWTNFTLTVNNVNDEPLISTDPSKSGTEDILYTVDFEAIDVDPTPDILNWVLDTNANFLSIVTSTGVVSGTPDDSGVGIWYVNVSVSDGNGGSDWLNYTLTINNVNDVPRITTTDVTIAIEDLEYIVDYEFIDSDPASAGDSHIWSLATSPIVSWLSIDSVTGVLSGTPSNNDTGIISVTVTIQDGKGGKDDHKFNLVIQNVNDAPVITNPQIGVYDWDEDVYNEIDFKAEDVDPTGDTLTWSIDTDADWLDMDPDTGVLSGIPTNAKVGEWEINVSVRDQWGLIDWNIFTINVLNTNDDPTINIVVLDDTFEDRLFWHVFIGYDIDPTDDVLTWYMDTNAAFLTMDSETGNVSGTPENNDVGSWWLNISVVDGNGGSAYLTLTLEIINVNDPPIIKTEDIPDATEDVLYYKVFNAEDIDPTMDMITWSITGSNADFVTIDPANGNLTMIPTNDHVGEYWILIEAFDPYGGKDSRNYTFEVLNVNDEPSISTDLLPFAIEDEPFWFVLNGSDVDPTQDTLEWSFISNAQFLTIDTSMGIISGTPTNDDVGNWWVNVTVTDGKGGYDFSNFTIEVINVNDPPVLNQTTLSLTFDEDSNGTKIDLNDIFLDIDGDDLSLEFSSSENLAITLVDNVLEIVPDTDWCGQEIIELTALDREESVSLNVSIEVLPINDAPYNVEIIAEPSYVEGEDQVVNSSAIDVDIPFGDELTYSWHSNISGEIGEGKSINLSLPVGHHLIYLTVTDSGGLSSQATMEIEIISKEGQSGDVDDDNDDRKEGMKLSTILVIVGSIVLILIVIFVIVFFYLKKKPDEDNNEQTEIESTKVPDEIEEQIPVDIEQPDIDAPTDYTNEPTNPEEQSSEPSLDNELEIPVEETPIQNEVLPLEEDTPPEAPLHQEIPPIDEESEQVQINTNLL